jgi:hypothetical protein
MGFGFAAFSGRPVYRVAGFDLPGSILSKEPGNLATRSGNPIIISMT